MVGVAGKSKACHDCKRRRVKCDFREPGCRRCEKVGIRCRGYAQAPVFVNRTYAAPATTALSAISEIKTKQTHPTTNVQTLACREAFERLKRRVVDASSPDADFRNQTWALLIDLYHPNARYISDPSIGGTAAYYWLEASCRLKGTSCALDRSLLAFGAILVNIVESGNASNGCSLQLYNEALHELVQDLGSRAKRRTNEILAAIVALSTCELFISPDDQAWRAHVNGISELLLEHDLAQNCPVWQSLCSRMRIICSLQGLAKRQALVLGAKMWRQLMYKESTPGSFDDMMDVLSEIPQLLEQAEAFYINHASIAVDQLSDLISLLLDSVDKLDNCKQALKLNSQKPTQWTVPSRLRNPSDDAFEDKLFPFAIEFESLDVAMPLGLASAVAVQILGTILLLHTRFSLAEADFMSATNLRSSRLDSLSSIQAEADRLARFVCQGMEYCHRIEMGALGPQSTCYAQWALRCYFRQVALERELEWCKNIKRMSGEGFRCRIELMAFGDDETFCKG